MLLLMVVGGWVLVAAACALLVGRGVRSAELSDLGPARPVDRSRVQQAYVQVCLFDATSLRDATGAAARQPVSVG